MPSRLIDYHRAHDSWVAQSNGSDKVSQIIRTKQGLVMLEIQGELNIPSTKPDNLNDEEENLFIQRTIPFQNKDSEEKVTDLVKFGRVELNEDTGEAVLFISKSQRLEGHIETLDIPFGVLRISKKDGQDCEMIDVIQKRIVFRNRPLPIM